MYFGIDCGWFVVDVDFYVGVGVVVWFVGVVCGGSKFVVIVYWVEFNLNGDCGFFFRCIWY